VMTKASHKAVKGICCLTRGRGFSRICTKRIPRPA
jgi:hypothetical protein